MRELAIRSFFIKEGPLGRLTKQIMNVPNDGFWEQLISPKSLRVFDYLKAF